MIMYIIRVDKCTLAIIFDFSFSKECLAITTKYTHLGRATSKKARNSKKAYPVNLAISQKKMLPKCQNRIKK